jgi:hypothetical protein
MVDEYIVEKHAQVLLHDPEGGWDEHDATTSVERCLDRVQLILASVE